MMSIRSRKPFKFGLAAVLLFLSAEAVGQEVDAADRARDLDSRLRDQMGETAFDSSGRPREPFLVVLVDVTQDDAVARSTGMKLILGQPKTNSTTADLIIESSASGAVKSSYRVPDPRFFKTEDRQWQAASTAVLRAFIPLDVTIDSVTIEPVPGREPFVSAGGAFDPRPLMKTACEAVGDVELDIHFSDCNGIMGLVFP